VNWANRALLATLLGAIPKARRQGLRLLVTPDTMLRWHRDIVRRRWATRSMRGKAGRRPARTSRPWSSGWPARTRVGIPRIHGELAGLGVKIAASTVWEILKKAGIDPAPRRSALTWSQFLRSQAEAILASDFFTAGLLDGTTPSSGRSGPVPCLPPQAATPATSTRRSPCCAPPKPA
jgi:transposase